MASKRIYQIAKELEREEKDIIEFLTKQGIKVGNRLSAVSEDAYNMVKAKFTAPPEPEPEPEPKPEPKPKPESKPKTKPKTEPKPKAEPKPAQAQPAPAETSTAETSADAPAKKKSKSRRRRKKKSAEVEEESLINFSDEDLVTIQPAEGMSFNRETQSALLEGMLAGKEFIMHASDGLTKKQRKEIKPQLAMNMDTWALLYDFTRDNPDSSPARYWDAIARLATMAFRLNNDFGMANREDLAKLRELVKPLGAKYVPREIFTDEENALFAEQQRLLFISFSCGMGEVNDSIYDLKLHAERMKREYEFTDLIDYVTNPDAELRFKARLPFSEIVDTILIKLRGEVRRFNLYTRHEPFVTAVIKNFFEWLDGYAKLKSETADEEKLAKYLYLEKRLIDLAEFASFDNLVAARKKNPRPAETVLGLLNNYRDNMDDPDAERDFKFKVRGVTQAIYKPKEYIFLYRFANLEPHKDYRPPEMIAAEEAAKAAKAAEEAAKAAEVSQAAEFVKAAEPAEDAPKSEE